MAALFGKVLVNGSVLEFGMPVTWLAVDGNHENFDRLGGVVRVEDHQRMEQLEKAGLVKIGKGPMPKNLLNPVTLAKPGESALDALLAERDEDER